jgi:trans-aconitate 2-methyltransferase
VKKLLFSASLLFVTPCIIRASNEQFKGELYAQHSTPQYTWAQRMIKTMDIQKGDRLFDGGCGDGRITAQMAAMASEGRVVGLDSSENMLAVARQHSSKVEWVHGRIEDSTVMQQYKNFDKATLFSVFHWIKKEYAQSALKNMYDLLADGGTAHFVMAAKSDDKPLTKALGHVEQSTKWKKLSELRAHEPTGSMEQYTVQSISELAVNANFKVVSCEEHLLDHVFNDKTAFYLWLTSVSPYVKFLDLQQHEEFCNDVIDTYASHVPSQNGAYNYITKQLYLTLQK